MKVKWMPVISFSEIRTTYSWGDGQVDYAEDLFFGSETPQGTEMPGRDWVEVALTLVDPVEVMIGSVGPNLNIYNGFLAASIALFDGFYDAITGEFFTWPRTTRRENGQIVGSPRNIVDSGDFLDSQSMSMEIR